MLLVAPGLVIYKCVFVPDLVIAKKKTHIVQMMHRLQSKNGGGEGGKRQQGKLASKFGISKKR